MKLTMKLTMKIILVISLFCSTAFADGDVNHGQKDDGSGGGFACVECIIDDSIENNEDSKANENADDSLLDMIKDFFGEILG